MEREEEGGGGRKRRRMEGKKKIVLPMRFVLKPLSFIPGRESLRREPDRNDGEGTGGGRLIVIVRGAKEEGKEEEWEIFYLSPEGLVMVPTPMRSPLYLEPSEENRKRHQKKRSRKAEGRAKVMRQVEGLETRKRRGLQGEKR
eukprot:768489-Hanusia_phi.AAC.6